MLEIRYYPQGEWRPLSYEWLARWMASDPTVRGRKPELRVATR